MTSSRTDVTLHHPALLKLSPLPLQPHLTQSLNQLFLHSTLQFIFNFNMARGNDTASKVFYKGKSEDFVVFVDDVEILKKWRNDRSIPLSDVVNGWKIFVTHRYVSSYPFGQSLASLEDSNLTFNSHGAQGIMDGASKATLEDEFGSHKEEDCMTKILEGGEHQAVTVSHPQTESLNSIRPHTNHATLGPRA